MQLVTDVSGVLLAIAHDGNLYVASSGATTGLTLSGNDCVYKNGDVYGWIVGDRIIPPTLATDPIEYPITDGPATPLNHPVVTDAQATDFMTKYKWPLIAGAALLILRR